MILARIVGVWWIFGGLVFLLCALVDPAQRALDVALGLFGLAGGTALLVARPPRQEFLAWLASLKGRQER
jgi:hypothetical protein